MSARDDLRAAAVSLDAYASHYSTTPVGATTLAAHAHADALRALADRIDAEMTRYAPGPIDDAISDTFAFAYALLARLDAPLQKEPR